LIFELPIYKKSLELAIYIEKIVKSWERYTKYTFGVDFRNKSKDILFLINRAYNSPENERLVLIKQLLHAIEDMKMLIQMAQELKAFKTYKQFEITSILTIQIIKQAQSWYNHHARITK
jgi:hypothetical protein